MLDDIDALWEKADADGNGRLSKEELEALLVEVGEKFPQARSFVEKSRQMVDRSKSTPGPLAHSTPHSDRGHTTQSQLCPPPWHTTRTASLAYLSCADTNGLCAPSVRSHFGQQPSRRVRQLSALGRCGPQPPKECQRRCCAQAAAPARSAPPR